MLRPALEDDLFLRTFSQEAIPRHIYEQKTSTNLVVAYGGFVRALRVHFEAGCLEGSTIPVHSTMFDTADAVDGSTCSKRFSLWSMLRHVRRSLALDRCRTLVISSRSCPPLQ